MTFAPKIDPAYFQQRLTVAQWNGTYEAGNLCRAWTVRLAMTKEDRAAFIQQAKDNGVLDGTPSFTGKLPVDRINAIKQSWKGRVPHGWNAQLNRPNPTESTGTIEAEQLFVTLEKITYPGTKKTVKARVVTLFKTKPNADGTLSEAKKVGEVNCVELGKSFLLFRKVDTAAVTEAGESDPNKGRMLLITAHSGEPVSKSGESKTVPLPEGVRFYYLAPSGYRCTVECWLNESDIIAISKGPPRFAAIEKTGQNSDLSVLPQTDKLRELTTTGGTLQEAAYDAAGLVQLTSGTKRPGYVADAELRKYHGVRNRPDRILDGERIPSIVNTRGGDTYDRVAFAALNESKTDIVTVRSRKLPHLSDLIDELNKIGILSQYGYFCLSVCREPFPVKSGKTARWSAAKDNIPHALDDEPEYRFFKRSTLPDGKHVVVEVDGTDEVVQEWIKRHEGDLEEESDPSENAPSETEISID